MFIKREEEEDNLLQPAPPAGQQDEAVEITQIIILTYLLEQK